MGREDFSQSSQLTTLVGRPTNRYVRLPKNVNTLRGLTDANKLKPNNRLHYSIYPSIAKEYEATYTQLTNLDFYSPIITILGNDPVSHLINTNYEDAGITVDVGSELVSTASTVDTNTFGVYKVTYTATDGINPDTTVVRTVKVGLPPDVTINGQNPFNLEKFDVYVDPGITINDSNSFLTSTTSTLNNLAVGTYTVNYTVSNPAFTEVFSRTVRVDDTIPPVITIAGDNPYELERFDPYVDEGATVDLGSELTNTDLSNVQNTAIGSFDVVYTAYDGNTTVSNVRTVNVVDTKDPVITILGDSPYTLERFDVYTDQGATVDVGSVLTTDVSAVNNTLIHGSSFEVTYTATDGNTAHDVTQTRTVNIVDTKPPVITLLGDVDPYQIQPAILFQDVDPGFEVDLGTSVSVDYSNVVTTDNSNFDVVYRASDGVNPDTVVLRRVSVADTLSPVVILNGPSVITLERYAEYVEQSVTLDPGSSLVSTTTDLDNTTVGSYTVTYLATDNINPNTTNVRTINVVDTTAPIVTLNGASSVTLERYGVFADTDPGVTIDANGTLASVDISQLNNTTQGTYTVTYNVVDDHNNANVITREVVVQDTAPPVVTLNNESVSYTLERYGDWSAIDPGVTIDRGSYVDSVTVDNTSTGLRVVTYTVKDGTNTTVKNRVITVEDTVAPVGSINNPSYQLERFGVFNDPGVTDLDPGTYLAGTDTSNVDNTLSPGSTFDVVYDLGDGTNNTHIIRTVTVVDTTVPVITLTDGDIGTTNYTVERGTTYVDPGATADTGETVTVNTSGLNMAVSGNYTVTYSATDADGNTGTASRTVVVEDTNAPVITLSGVNPYTVERGTTYVDPGATADTGETVTVNTSQLNMAVSGNYTVTYSATDVDGNTGAASRTVVVEDTNAPVITLSGANPYTVERASNYVDPGATVDTGETVTVNTSGLNMAVSGNYTVTYSATDVDGNTGTASRTVIVEDTTVPVITLTNGDIGTTNYTVERGTTYVDPGATADTGETVTVNISGLNMAVSGNYIVTYSATDVDGNTGTASRTVVVEDTNAPVITLSGANPYTVERASNYVDPGATADTGETVTANASGLNMAVSGTYTVTYSATDVYGNTGTASRTVVVEDTNAPVITLSGANPYTVELASNYVDPGATADTGETVTVNTSGLNMAVSGNYTVTYSATDADGNTGTAIRNVYVRDTTAPVITLTNGDIGTTNYTVERGTTYVDPGATADTGEYITVNTSQLNMTVSGTYTVTYSATDVDGNTGTASRTVIVEDNNAPVITLTDGDPGTTIYTVERGTTYVDPGATADTGETVTVDTSQLNMAVSDTYTVTYSATDVDGNTGTANRTVVVEDTNAPVITLTNGDIGTTNYTVERGTTYVDPGATADTNETVSDNRSSNLNMAVSGTYIVTYSATDVDGNTGTADRIVIVEDNNAPVITLTNGDIGTTNYTVERGTTYVDPGATADTGETVTVDTSQLNMDVSDTYTVTYSATDVDGNTGTASRTVIVEDNNAPVITLSGANPYTVEIGTNYVDPGATADTGETVTVNTSQLNMAVSDTYTVTYSATDVDGNTGTASRTVIVELGWSEQQKIQPSNKSYQYPVSISEDGNTAIVGAYQDDAVVGTNTIIAAGAAYIFTWSGTSWTQQQKIQASDKQALDFFGASVAISGDGNTAIVGAFQEDTGGTSAGAAYIFTRSGTSWSEQQKIQASDKQGGDYFGQDVAISEDGNTAIVGAYREDTGGSQAGAAYIFTWSGTTWTQQQKIQASDKQASDEFGKSVAISGDGNTAIVGARLEDAVVGSNTIWSTGAAYIFTWSGTTWSEQQKIQASDKQGDDQFGQDVAISGDGNTVIVGAYREDTGATNAGAVYIFTRSGTTWSQQSKIQASDKQASDEFGNSVSISEDGNTAIVGAYREDPGGTTDAGAAYIFTWSETSSSWSEQQKIQASDKQAGDEFGGSVAISGDGDTAIVGKPGAAYIHRYNF